MLWLSGLTRLASPINWVNTHNQSYIDSKFMKLHRTVFLAGLAAASLLLNGCISVSSHREGHDGGHEHSHSHANVEAEVIALEKAAWKNYQDRNAAAFRAHSHPSYRAVFDTGVQTLDQSVAEMSNVEIKSWALSDIKVAFPEKDTAVLTYRAETVGSYKGENTSGTYYSSAVWVREGHRWLGVLYTEVKAK